MSTSSSALDHGATATIVGVETGAQIIQQLKRHKNVDFVVAIAFIIVLVGISTFIAWESWQTLKMGKGSAKSSKTKPKQDRSAIAYIAKSFQRFHFPPMISLPNSGIKQISLWTILVVAYIGGVFSGFLGGGAGYIRMPAMVYILGVPTHVAVGTDLFEVVISASYGHLHACAQRQRRHPWSIALVMHTGAAIGAQIGATLTQYFHGARHPRLAFQKCRSPLLGAGLILYSLMTGHHFK